MVDVVEMIEIDLDDFENLLNVIAFKLMRLERGELVLRCVQQDQVVRLHLRLRPPLEARNESIKKEEEAEAKKKVKDTRLSPSFSFRPQIQFGLCLRLALFGGIFRAEISWQIDDQMDRT